MLQADDKLIPRKSHSTVSIKSFKSVLLPDCRPWSLFANELTPFFAFIVFISSLNLVKKEGACFQKFMKILENKRLFGRIHY